MLHLKNILHKKVDLIHEEFFHFKFWRQVSKMFIHILHKK